MHILFVSDIGTQQSQHYLILLIIIIIIILFFRYPRFVLSCLPSPQGHISHTLSLPIITHSSYNDDTRAPHPSDVTTPTIRLVSGLKSKPSISRPHTQPSQLREQSPSSRLIWSRSRSSVEPKSVKLAKFNKYPIIPSGRTSVTVSLLILEHMHIIHVFICTCTAYNCLFLGDTSTLFG